MFDPWSLESAVMLLTAADLLDGECPECGGRSSSHRCRTASPLLPVLARYD